MQYTVALDTTIDYKDWHKGRKFFGLWYIDLDNHKNLKEYCDNLQNEFNDILHPDYHRQFHITVFVNGFWVDKKYYDDDFDKHDLHIQISKINSLNLSPFQLTVDKVGAFLNSVHLAVKPSMDINNIRYHLNKTHQEINPSEYMPHITLGFFKDRYNYQEILTRLTQIKLKPMIIDISTLSFGVYQANQLQGRLKPIYELKLIKN